jgi:hypothetical protein
MSRDELEFSIINSLIIENSDLTEGKFSCKFLTILLYQNRRLQHGKTPQALFSYMRGRNWPAEA